VILGSESHPKCEFKLSQVELPCGHPQRNIACWRSKDPAQLKCSVKAEKELPCGALRRCCFFSTGLEADFQRTATGHAALLDCGSDPHSHRCAAMCGALLSCAHQSCRGRCSDCKALQQSGAAFGHVQHAHEKMKVCGHECRGSCFDHRFLPLSLHQLVLARVFSWVLQGSEEQARVLRAVPVLSRAVHHARLRVALRFALQRCAEECRLLQEASKVRLPVPFACARTVPPPGLPAAFGKAGPSGPLHHDDDSRRLRPERP
jgi:hypothetical protein